jgi:hypothetical protein
MTTQLPKFLPALRTVRSRAQLSPLGSALARSKPSRNSIALASGMPAFVSVAASGEPATHRLFAPGLLDRLQAPLSRIRE